MHSPAHPVDLEQLSAWLDGELDAEQATRVEAWLAGHPEDAARVQRWAADRDAMRDRLAPLLDEPVPQPLQQLVRGSPPRRAVWQRAAMAAGLMLAGGTIGAALTWQAQRAGSLAAAPRAGEWVQRAAVAHAVYAPEVRHPVEVPTDQGTAAEQQAQEQHLSRWLTKRLAMPVKLFDLRGEGFELIGGRLLPDAPSPSAQLMYQNGGGQRVTVYLRKPEPGAMAAFRFEQRGELGLFYWVDETTGYALVGTLPRERLLQLAERIHRQGLGAASAPATGS